MKHIIILLVGIMSSYAMAAQKDYHVSKENRPFAKEMAKEANTEYLTTNGNFKALDEAELHGEALYAWKASERDSRDLGALFFHGKKLLIVEDVSDGNGCFYYFNTAGEFLNSYCGTESEDWNWEVK
jgi:hypothetical protein